MDIQLFLSIILWLMIGSATAYFASNRGRDPWIWFMIGMLLGILGLLLVFLLPPVKESKSPSDVEDKDFAILELDPEPPPKNLAPEQEWFYYDRQQQRHGPVRFETLKELWKEKEIDEETFLWSEGMADWKKLESVQDLYAKLLA